MTCTGGARKSRRLWCWGTWKVPCSHPSGVSTLAVVLRSCGMCMGAAWRRGGEGGDRKSTRLNSSHANISYAVFCLKKKKNNHISFHPSPQPPHILLAVDVRSSRPFYLTSFSLPSSFITFASHPVFPTSTASFTSHP